MNRIATLRVTSFHDRRTVELHQRHDEIVRRRFQQRVAWAIEAKRAADSVSIPHPAFMRRGIRRQAG